MGGYIKSIDEFPIRLHTWQENHFLRKPDRLIDVLFLPEFHSASISYYNAKYLMFIIKYLLTFTNLSVMLYL